MRALLLFVSGFAVLGLISGVPLDLSRKDVVTGGLGSCDCFRHFCYCHGYDDGTKVGVSLMVDETRHNHPHCCRAYISGMFYVNKTKFEKIFPANQLEDFCKTVHGKRFCFRIDIHDKSTESHLHGCLALSKPETVNMGCFELPLLEATKFVTYEDSPAYDEDEEGYYDNDDGYAVAYDGNDVAYDEAYEDEDYESKQQDELLFEPRNANGYDY